MPNAIIAYLRDASGNYARFNTSGFMLTSSSISGNQVSISGQPLAVSGANFKEFGTSVLTGAVLTVTSNSGGVSLGSGAVFKAFIKNRSGNNTVYVGGNSNNNYPNSGIGFELLGGETTPALAVDNLNDVRLFAVASGNIVSYMGYA